MNPAGYVFDIMNVKQKKQLQKYVSTKVIWKSRLLNLTAKLNIKKGQQFTSA